MFGKNEETSSEPQQIIILTLAMTAGGFLLLYLFLQFWLLTPKETKPPFVLYAVIAVVASVTIFAMFRYTFDLLLPAGPLTPYLP